MNSIAFKNLKEGDRLRNILTQNIFAISRRVEVLGQVHYYYIASWKKEYRSVITTIVAEEAIITASCASDWELVGVNESFQCPECYALLEERTKNHEDS